MYNVYGSCFNIFIIPVFSCEIMQHPRKQKAWSPYYRNLTLKQEDLVASQREILMKYLMK